MPLAWQLSQGLHRAFEVKEQEEKGEAVLLGDDLCSLRLFGSVAREQQTEQSDIDVCVEMDPKPFVRLHVKDYLERLLGCSVDVIRKHQHMNSFLLNQIDKEGIYVF